jgi:hypothetical protein
LSGLASKPLRQFLISLDLKIGGDSFWRFGPQNLRVWFGDLSLKITATVSCFVPQNQADFDLSVAPQN